MRNTNNLVPFIEKLNDKHKAFLVRVVSIHGGLTTNIHHGTLPFLSKDVAIECLRKHLALVTTSTDNKAERRYSKEILNRFGVTTDSMTLTFKFFLNDGKVYRSTKQLQTNVHEIRLPFFVEREVGRQWQEFGKKWVSPPENKIQLLQLTRLSRGLWEVVCPAIHADKVKGYLLERFGE